MNETEKVLALITELQSEVIPAETVAFLKDCLLDYIGVSLAGAHDLKEKFHAYLKQLHSGESSAAIIGIEARTSPESAALLNGMAAHYFELDDGSRFGMVHIGAVVFSALLAVSELYEISAGDFLRAAWIGYEVTIRMAAGMQPGHKKRGFHATGTCGCIGAAAAVAVALHYDDNALADTVSAAAASASGLLEMIEDTSQLKPFNAGKAAQNAVIAARIGAAGFSGPLDPIGGKRGLLAATADGFDETWLRRDGDRKYALFGIYRKPYASCRHCHSPVEAALALADSARPEEIEAVDVYTYGLAVFGHDHAEVSGVGAAKMSIPYSVAAAICMKTGGMSAMSEAAVKNETILELAKRVRVIERKEYSALVPAKRIAELAIHLKSGEELRKTVVYPKGEPENPMSEREQKEKFLQMAAYAGKDETFCTDIARAVDNLENDFSTLLRLL